MADEVKEIKKPVERWFTARIKAINKTLKEGKTKDGKEIDKETRAYLRGKLDAFREVDRVETKKLIEKAGKEWVPYDEYKETKKAASKEAKETSKDEVDDEVSF